MEHDAIDRYLAGQSDPAEQERARDYLAARPGAAAFHEALRGMLQHAARGVSSHDEKVAAEASFTAVQARVQQAQVRPGQQGRGRAKDVLGRRALRKDFFSKRTLQGRGRRTPTTHRVLIWASGCGVALLMIAGLFRVREPKGHSAIGQTYATTRGKIAKVRLPDGTRVSIGPETHMLVAHGFGVSHRTINLVGEAFFEVPSAAGVPFIVRTGRVATRVLGTTFSVRRYAGDAEAQVQVQSGRVAATSPHVSVTVAAGTVATVTDSTSIIASRGSVYTDWADGRLVFKDARIGDMLAAVGRWYGYRFRLTDSALASRRATITFATSDVTEMLMALKTLLDVELVYSTSGDSVVILVPIRSRTVPGWNRQRQDILKPSTEMGK